MENKKHIIDKIIKIYNKSKNNPSEHEVKAAVLKVQEMLMKYNLSMLDVKIEEDPEDVKSIKYGKKSRWWHRKLGIIIANNFRCKFYLQKSYNQNCLVFLGLETDVNICVETFNYVKEAVTYNCKIHISSRKLRKKENIKIAKDSFIEGFIIGLDHALKKQNDNNEWGLVLQTPVEVQKFYDKITFSGESMLSRNNEDKIDLKAFNDGLLKGKELNINLDKIMLS